MRVPPWLLGLHLLGLVVYAGGVLALTRLLGHAVRFESEAARAASYRIFRRMHFLVDWIGLALLLGTGLTMLLWDPAGKAYLKQPYFHVKLTCIALLLACDFGLLTRGLLRLDPAGPQPSAARYKALHGFAALCVVGALAAVTVLKG